MKILLVEDDRYLSEAIVDILKKHKMSVDHCQNGQDGFDYGLSGIYDVIILDIMLPLMDGYQVLSKLRKEKIMTPILMLTAKSSLEDKVEGFQLGADDYLTKPFESQELIMRLMALNRRAVSTYNADILTFENISLNTYSLELNNEKEGFTLTTKEFLIMEMLMRNQEMILSKNQIIEKVWGFDSEAQDNNVETYISFLRKKLESLHAKIQIVTIRFQGYVLKKCGE